MPINRPDFNPKPVILSSNKITLKPLTMADSAGFYQAGKDSKLCQWVAPNHCLSLAVTKDWIAQSLNEQRQNRHIPFVIIDNESNTIIGSTRYCSIRPADRNIEIGFTFITPEYQRSYVNSHAKLLLLQQAFEKLGAIRVELKTHENNLQSRNAITRIGATFEGILRNHRILANGSLRNTAIFSITEQQWPAVKSALKLKIKQYEALEF